MGYVQAFYWLLFYKRQARHGNPAFLQGLTQNIRHESMAFSFFAFCVNPSIVKFATTSNRNNTRGIPIHFCIPYSLRQMITNENAAKAMTNSKKTESFHFVRCARSSKWSRKSFHSSSDKFLANMLGRFAWNRKHLNGPRLDISKSTDVIFQTAVFMPW